MLTATYYNYIVVKVMLPNLKQIPGAPWPVLPEGIHVVDFETVSVAFATNARRRSQFDGLIRASGNLRDAGCSRLYLDGSYVTGKPWPGDYDACWDPTGVVEDLLDPVFLNFDDDRAAQKAKYLGEFFPSSFLVGEVGTTFLEFFQIERFSGLKKGIVQVELVGDPMIGTR